jgi:hypothetical protein
VTAVVTANRGEVRFISVKPRIHWVNLNSLKILDVLPGGFEEAQADYVGVGLHSHCHRAECSPVDGPVAGHGVRLGQGVGHYFWIL